MTEQQSTIGEAITELTRSVGIRSGARVSRNSSAATCTLCSNARLCLPHGLERTRLHEFECIVDEVGPLHAGNFVFRDGDEFTALYAVRAGMVKTYSIDREGREQITGFYLPGELIGLDAIHSQRYRNHALALDTSMVCRMNFAKVRELAQQWPELQNQLMCTLSSGLAEADKLRGEYSADERMAGFLVDLAR